MQTDKEKYKIFEFFYKKAAEVGMGEAFKLIECREEGGPSCQWHVVGVNSPVNGYEYRIKPETVQHKGGEYPKPCTVEEAEAAEVAYSPSFSTRGACSILLHGEADGRIGIAKLGLAYLKEEDAIARAKVIFELES